MTHGLAHGTHEKNRQEFGDKQWLFTGGICSIDLLLPCFSCLPWAINDVTGEAPMLRSLDLKDRFDFCGRAGWQ